MAEGNKSVILSTEDDLCTTADMLTTASQLLCDHLEAKSDLSNHIAQLVHRCIIVAMERHDRTKTAWNAALKGGGGNA